MEWETVGTAAVTALVTTLVASGVTKGVPRLWVRLRTPRLEWTVTRNTANQWVLRREGKRLALEVSYTLGFKGTNVTPAGGAGDLFAGVADVAHGYTAVLPDVEWDEIGVGWIERSRRVGVHAEVTDDAVKRLELRGASDKWTP